MRNNIIIHSMVAIAVVMAVLFLPVSYSHAGDNPERANTIIQKIINAYGGKDKLSKVYALSAVGHIKKLFPYDEGPYFRVMKRERKLLFDSKYSRVDEKRILNNGKGYRETDGATEAVTGPPYDAMVFQYNQIDLPFGLLDGSLTVVSLRKDSINDHDAEVLHLKDQYGYEIDVFVDPQDFLILKAISYCQAGQDRRSIGVEFSDFREVEGILLPHKIVNYANDFKLTEKDIMKYRINPHTDDAQFNP
jgi:hypothetical protein